MKRYKLVISIQRSEGRSFPPEFNLSATTTANKMKMPQSDGKVELKSGGENELLAPQIADLLGKVLWHTAALRHRDP